MKHFAIAIVLRDTTSGKEILLAEKKKHLPGTTVLRPGINTLLGPATSVEEKRNPAKTLCTFSSRHWRLWLTEPEPAALLELQTNGVAVARIHIFRAGVAFSAARETYTIWEPKWYSLASVPLERIDRVNQSWFWKVVAGETFYLGLNAENGILTEKLRPYIVPVS